MAFDGAYRTNKNMPNLAVNSVFGVPVKIRTMQATVGATMQKNGVRS